jgi:adhesin/invasin
MSYTPIPLVSLSADYQRGQDGLSETFITVGLSFELGTPIEKQLSPRAVKSRRLLSNARYDLIARRNDVVLDYHRNAEGSIQIPTELHGVAGSVMSFPITVSGSSIQNVTWVGTAGPYATVYGGGANGGLRLPPYRAGASNSYTLKAVGTDGAGNLVQSNPLQVYVDSLKLTIERSVSVSALLGSTIVGFTATLKGPDGHPVPDSEIRWRVSGDADVMSKDVKTGRDGRAILEVASSSTQKVLITVEEPQGASAQLGTIIESNSALALDNRNPITPGEVFEINI